MTKKLIKLSILIEEVNKRGEDIIYAAKHKGKSMDYFLDRKMKVPMSISDEDIETDEEGRVLLDQDIHFEKNYYPMYIDIDDISSFYDSKDDTTLYTTSDIYYTVKEKAEEIKRLIDSTRKTFWQKLWSYC